MFEEFLQLLGDKMRLRGFDKYKGGLGMLNSLIYDENKFYSPQQAQHHFKLSIYNREAKKHPLMIISCSFKISDTVHDLTGLYSVYTNWRNIEIMFHVSTQLPYEKHDPQKLQRKRHIGNDIVCVVFLEADNTAFSPSCIKSHFLHTFILVTKPLIVSLHGTYF